MDTLLIDLWIDAAEATRVIDAASAAVVRDAVRSCGAEIGLAAEATERAAIVASELVQNQLAHARHGLVRVRSIARAGVPGIEIVAADRGEGIADPARALEGKRSPTSLGGLSGARRLAQEMDIDVRSGEGTCVTARVFGEPVPRRREVGVYGRPCEGEGTSGDAAAFVRTNDGLLVALADGLGHGPLAWDASSRAMETMREHATLAPADLLSACHTSLEKTRGAVMAAAVVDERAGSFVLAGAGNVTVRIERPGGSRTFAGTAFILGPPMPRRKVAKNEAGHIEPFETLVLFSDGLRTAANVAETPELFVEHPVVIAQRLIESFGQSNDDVMVLVAK